MYKIQEITYIQKVLYSKNNYKCIRNYSKQTINKLQKKLLRNY